MEISVDKENIQEVIDLSFDWLYALNNTEDTSIYLIVQIYRGGEIKEIIGYCTDENEAQKRVKKLNKYSVAPGESYSYGVVWAESMNTIDIREKNYLKMSNNIKTEINSAYKQIEKLKAYIIELKKQMSL